MPAITAKDCSKIICRIALSKDNNKNHPIDVQRLTGHSISGNL